MEKLTVKNMTASAAGTLEEPGKNVQQKAGLNREVLDAAPAHLMTLISFKVQETGGWFLEAPTRQLKPSQRCPACGTCTRKSCPNAHTGASSAVTRSRATSRRLASSTTGCSRSLPGKTGAGTVPRARKRPRNRH